MHPEIEKLIDLIIIDGKITEKERDVLIKKAKELGVDADEVIITLDAKLYQKEAPLTKIDKDEKYGNRKKCPACGAPIKSMEVACLCGHEFTGTNASKNIITFFNEIKNKHIEEQAIIISSYPIPNNKQDVLEFLALSIGNCKALNNFERMAYIESQWTGKFSKELGHREAVINAWQSKTLQAINQGKILFMDDASLINEIVRYEKQFLEISKDPRLVAQKKAMVVFGFMMLILIFFYAYLYKSSYELADQGIEHSNNKTQSENRKIELEKSTENLYFTEKLDSISNPKLKEEIKTNANYYYKDWESFKMMFFDSYPDYNYGYVLYSINKYKFSNQISYKIAENQFNNIKIKFKNPIDFLLFDDRNNLRILSNTSKVDSIFILTLISKNRWKIKKEIDNKIKLIQYTELVSDLSSMNDVDSSIQAGLIHWNEAIVNFILQENKGFYPREGYIQYIMKSYRIDDETAKKFCFCRLNFFKKKFKKPIDYFYYRDNIYYNNNDDNDDKVNGNFCRKLFNLK